MQELKDRAAGTQEKKDSIALNMNIEFKRNRRLINQNKKKLKLN